MSRSCIVFSCLALFSPIFSNLYTSKMSVAIEIVPLSCTLDMYGEPDSSCVPSFRCIRCGDLHATSRSAYSLSGHVSISLQSAFSLFESRRTVSLLLQSLELTFEGQSEVLAPAIGYSALRLCSITRQLAPAEGVELNNEGHEESKEPCQFDTMSSCEEVLTGCVI